MDHKVTTAYPRLIELGLQLMAHRIRQNLHVAEFANYYPPVIIRLAKAVHDIQIKRWPS